MYATISHGSLVFIILTITNIFLEILRESVGSVEFYDYYWHN